MKAYTIHRYSERSLLLQWQGLSLQEANSRVNDLYHKLLQLQSNDGWQLIPAYQSLLVVVNSFSILKNAIAIIEEILLKEIPPAENDAEQLIIIPVCYHPALGNDLQVLAAMHNKDAATISAMHAAKKYQVFMLGFLPGFAYMGLVNEEIASPRKPKPVPTKAGAVGIAGRQTGIYPMDSAGGWQIVGYTPLKMFDACQSPPVMLKPGDWVQFKEIELEEYYEWEIGNSKL